jgi:hypothetical protein
VSLTSVLDDPASSLSVFLDERFPAIQGLALTIEQQLAGYAIPAIREHGRTIPWRTIGTAIDHRLRLAFTPDATPRMPGQPPANPASTNAITAGVHYALIRSNRPDSDHIYRNIARLGLQLITRFQVLAGEAKSFDPAVPVCIGGRMERDLCTLCYAGAWYDALHRTGDIDAERNHELRYAAATSDDLDDMLTVIPELAIANMADLVRHAGGSSLADLRKGTETRLCITGPCFSGSRDVDGADADLIIDTVLLEIKAHANPAQAARDTLRQILGYLILDYQDTYKLARASIYYVRHARLVHWEIPDLLRAAGYNRRISEVRKDCAATLRNPLRTQQQETSSRATSRS